MEQHRANVPSAANDVSSRNRESTATASLARVNVCVRVVLVRVLTRQTVDYT